MLCSINNVACEVDSFATCKDSGIHLLRIKGLDLVDFRREGYVVLACGLVVFLGKWVNCDILSISASSEVGVIFPDFWV